MASVVVGRLASVNVGRPKMVPWFGRQVRTAIWKFPVAGRVALAGDNLAGDDQADRRVHGGYDKAVYAYAAEDYQWWEQAAGGEFGPGTFGAGTFGDNLTTSGVDLPAAVVGERWAIGTAILEVSQPRQPCFKLGIRMGTTEFVDRFEAAGRYGTYLRIVAGGELGTGDEIVLVHRPDHGLRIADLIRAHLGPDPDAALMARIASAPDVPEGWRTMAERAIKRGR
ncbi:MAG: MOSC domain-containing protein [Actinomycetota bacterium]|nr:MOSC domain-containing protein [Actinomycetota bacterium]